MKVKKKSFLPMTNELMITCIIDRYMCFGEMPPSMVFVRVMWWSKNSIQFLGVILVGVSGQTQFYCKQLECPIFCEENHGSRCICLYFLQGIDLPYVGEEYIMVVQYVQSILIDSLTKKSNCKALKIRKHICLQM